MQSPTYGKPFTITGFMTPLATTSPTRHFIVTRRSMTCPFCPPNTSAEAIEVHLASPAPFTDQQVRVEERTALAPTGGQGPTGRPVGRIRRLERAARIGRRNPSLRSGLSGDGRFSARSIHKRGAHP
jgi:hypothetical protein